MFEKRLKSFASLALIFLQFSCENPYEKVKADAKNFPSLSKSRVVGSECSETDSATEKRAAYHPLGPTGGWSGKAGLDYSRTSDTAKNVFRKMSEGTVGFVEFETEGVIRSRSYDDTYGSVYCGWSPNTVAYSPQSKAVYLRMDRCSVGDGGLAQVTEICWFPKGAKQGKIIYSTAHPETSTDDEYLFYSKENIGSLTEQGGKRFYYYNDSQAGRIFHSLMRAGRRQEAHELVLDTLQKFDYLGSAVDGSTGRPIPSKEFYADEWKSLLLMKAGFEIFERTGKESLDEAQRIISEATNCTNCDYAKGLMPYYLWALSAVQGQKNDLPRPTSREPGVHGYDPQFVYKVLSDATVSEASLPKSDFTLGGETTYFWIGVREYLAGNKAGAGDNLQNYLSHPNTGASDFELSATLSLLAQIGELRKGKAK